MVGVFSWNDVDVLFTFNVDIYLKLTLPRSQKTSIFKPYAIDGYHFVLNISHRPNTIEPNPNPNFDIFPRSQKIFCHDMPLTGTTLYLYLLEAL